MEDGNQHASLIVFSRCSYQLAINHKSKSKGSLSECQAARSKCWKDDSGTICTGCGVTVICASWAWLLYWNDHRRNPLRYHKLCATNVLCPGRKTLEPSEHTLRGGDHLIWLLAILPPAYAFLNLDASCLSSQLVTFILSNPFLFFCFYAYRIEDSSVSNSVYCWLLYFR